MRRFALPCKGEPELPSDERTVNGNPPMIGVGGTLANAFHRGRDTMLTAADYGRILHAKRSGMSIREISRRLMHDRETITKVVNKSYTNAVHAQSRPTAHGPGSLYSGSSGNSGMR